MKGHVNVKLMCPFHNNYRNFIQARSPSYSYNTHIKTKEETLMDNNVFEAFNNGSLKLPITTTNFADIAWSKHPTFEGVELKHILTGKDTNGQFSYHLVRIAPNKSIKNHIHETQLETHEVIAGSGVCINDGAKIAYEVGTISIMPAKIPHEVNAGEDGLYLFAKFFPALC